LKKEGILKISLFGFQLIQRRDPMRVSHNQFFESPARQLEKITERLWKLQRNISSGKEILTVSDDPCGAIEALNYRDLISQIKMYGKNIESALSWLSYTESLLGQIEDILQRAKEIALQQSSSTAGAQARDIAAHDVKEIFNQVLQIANSKLSDRYIFSGTKTNIAPFTDNNGDLDVDDGIIDRGYQGNTESIILTISNTSNVTINCDGKSLFELSESSTIFSILRNLYMALVNNDQEVISEQMGLIDNAMDHVRGIRAEVGSRINILELEKEHIGDVKINLTDLLSKVEDLDMVKAITELSNQQLLYQAALQSTALISRMSLMDFLK
jgi:flagellar hook-associated protein 3 FlgL